MKKKIEWSTSTNKISPIEKPQTEPSGFQSAVVKPEFGSRKQRLNVGVNWLRFLPAIVGSKEDWMMPVECYNMDDIAEWAKPSQENDLVAKVQNWLRKNAPEKLWDKEKKTGYRLWPKKQGIAWAIDQHAEEGKRLCLFRSSLYGGEYGGTPGLAYTIKTTAEAVDTEPGSPTAGQKIHGDITDPGAGRLVKVEKVQPPGKDSYPSYRVAIGSQPAPLETIIELLTDEEHDLLCKLEETVHEPTIEEQAKWLRAYLGPDFPEEILGGKPKPKPTAEEEDEIPMNFADL
jgi:hypothetical protein